MSKFFKYFLLLLAAVLVAGSFIWYSGQNFDPAGNEVITRRGIHWHYTLAIYLSGEKQEIPAGIGLGPVERPLHTHEPDGVIHLEFSGFVTRTDTRIGKFFEIWGKKFNQDCIFDYCNEGPKKVRFLVNGKKNFDFENYEAKDGDEVEIRYE